MLRVVVDKSVSSALAKLTPDTQSEVLAELRRLPGAFGRPHIHAGLGIRQLRPGVYEARVGLEVRVVFERDGDLLVIKTVGDHGDVRRYLSNRT
jgi:mRNA-degrading endonuclease RelE of RelBE toxin-antitoxin system